MTNAELARELGVSRAYITMLEQGKRQPSKKLHKRIDKLTWSCSLSSYNVDDSHARGHWFKSSTAHHVIGSI